MGLKKIEEIFKHNDISLTYNSETITIKFGDKVYNLKNDNSYAGYNIRNFVARKLGLDAQDVSLPDLGLKEGDITRKIRPGSLVNNSTTDEECILEIENYAGCHYPTSSYGDVFIKDPDYFLDGSGGFSFSSGYFETNIYNITALIEAFREVNDSRAVVSGKRCSILSVCYSHPKITPDLCGSTLDDLVILCPDFKVKVVIVRGEERLLIGPNTMLRRKMKHYGDIPTSIPHVKPTQVHGQHARKKIVSSVLYATAGRNSRNPISLPDFVAAVRKVNTKIYYMLVALYNVVPVGEDDNTVLTLDFS